MASVLQRRLRPAPRQGPGNPHFLLALKPVGHVPMTTAQRNKRRLQPCEAADVATALALGFLPWSGCSQGGFYSTGVQGTHGEGCQAIYQPAAAAEARFAAAQQQALNATAPPLAAGAAAALSSSEAAGAATHDAVLASIAVSSSDSHTHNRTNRADADSSASNSRSSINQDSSKSGTGQSIGLEGPFTDFEQQGTTSEQLQQVPESVKDLVREILKADNAARTKQLVDDAWQTLE